MADRDDEAAARDRQRKVNADAGVDPELLVRAAELVISRQFGGLHPEHGRAGIGTSLFDSGPQRRSGQRRTGSRMAERDSSEFSFIELPGDHMYLVDRAQEALDLIEAKSVDG